MRLALKLSGAFVSLGGRTALRGVSLTASSGEVVGVVGANGAGKTTMLRAALGLAQLEAGAAELGGQPLKGMSSLARARLAGYLPQERRVAWNMPAWRVAALGAIAEPPGRAEILAREALSRVDLADLAERGVLEMSGGERGRVLLARLLVTGAPLLLADEPIAGLDPDAQLLVLDLLRAEAEAGRAVVLTLHDLSLAARSCDRLVVLNHGVVIAAGPPREALSTAVLAEAFNLAGDWHGEGQDAVLALRRVR